MKRSVFILFALFLTFGLEASTQSGGANAGWTRTIVAPSSSRAEIATVADLNRDGWDDVVYTSWDNCQVRLVANNQNANPKFSDSMIIGSANSCMPELFQARNVEVARVLPDKPDPQILVSAFQGGHHMYVKLSGSWVRYTIDLVNYGPAGIAAGLINGDGLPDVVTVTQGFAGAAGTIKFWRNLDSGQFQQMASYAVNNPASVAIVDVDRDGANDVVAAIGGGVVWFRNLGGFSFSTAATIASGLGEVSKVEPADLNRDGVADYVITSHTHGVWFVDGAALGVPSPVSSTFLGAYFAATGFFSYPDDGLVDIAVSTGSPSNAVILFRRNPNGTFTADQANDPGVAYVTGRSVKIGDFRHDGKRQLVTTSYGGGTVDIWDRQ